MKNTKYVSIQKKIIVSISALSIISIFVLGALAYNISISSFKSKLTSYVESILDQISLNAEQRLQSLELIADKIIQSSTMKDIENLSKVEDSIEYYQLSTSVITRFTELINSNPGVESISFIFEDESKEIIGALPEFIKDEERKKTRDEYTAMAKRDKDKLSWTYIKESTKDSIHLAMVAPVRNKKTGEFIGTIAIVCRKSVLSDIYKGVEIGSGSIIYSQSSNGVLIAEKSGSELDKLYIGSEFMKALSYHEGTGKKHYDFLGKKGTELLVFSRIPNTDLYNIGIIPASNYSKNAIKMILPLALIAIFSLILGCLLLSILVKSIVQPLRKFIAYIKVVGAGDLYYRVEDTGKDEINIINKNFGDMLTNIALLIKNVRDLTSEIFTGTEKIVEISDNSEAAVVQVATTMEEVSKGADSQAFGLQNGSAQMESLAGRIDDIISKISQVSNIIQKSKNTISESIITIKMLNDKSGDTDGFSREIIAEVNMLNEEMREISSITEAIISVSEQTNLLSLNAAIEAARAGEAGRGFSVVADEVRRLAGQSKEASAKISNTINDIVGSIESTSSKAIQSRKIVQEQIEAVEKTTNSFTNMHKTMDGVNGKIWQMIDSVKNISELKDNVMKMMLEVSSISQQTVSITEEVSARTEEQISGIKQLGILIEQMTDLQKVLNNSIEIFNISYAKN